MAKISVWPPLAENWEHGDRRTHFKTTSTLAPTLISLAKVIEIASQLGEHGSDTSKKNQPIRQATQGLGTDHTLHSAVFSFEEFSRNKLFFISQNNQQEDKHKATAIITSVIK